MKIVVFGKAPPLQGGVASRTYSFLRQVAKREVKLTFVTNSEAAGATYKSHFDQSDKSYFQASLGRTTILNVSRDTRITHIPHSEAFETRLLGISAEAAREADLLIGWYYQPYGVVAATLGNLLTKPTVLLHAGSDIGRLAKNPEFLSAYQVLFSNSRLLANTKHTAGLLRELFHPPDEEMISVISGADRLPEYFSAKCQPADVDLLRGWTSELYADWRIPTHTRKVIDFFNSSEIPRDTLIIGVYGKTAVSKGHISLLRALEELGRRGQDFFVVFCTGGHIRRIQELVHEADQLHHVRSRIHIYPFIPPWKIPRFVKFCDLVAFLENGFEIDFHGPQVPREILMAGTALLCSSEISRKQRWGRTLRPGTHFIDAGNPTEIDTLAQTIASAISDRMTLKNIGIAGRTAALGMQQVASSEDSVLRTLRRHYSI